MTKLFDSYGRQITYVRLAVTDRCNLRCTYCMPVQGTNIVEKKELLTYKEMYRIIRVLSELGVDKVRLTGGEPFVRKDLINFIKMMSFNDLLKEISITTNGVLISEYIEKLQTLKVKTINLSIDSLNSEKFKKITRRNVFDKVWKAYKDLEKSNLNLKLNVVVQPGVNTEEINNFVSLSKQSAIEIRFIEEMPFNGSNKISDDEIWNFNKILNEIKKENPNIETLPTKKSSTSRTFKLKNSKGIIGIIPAYSRTICNDCNRIRITPTGQLKNCLFDEGVYSIRDFLRKGVNDEELKKLFVNLISKKPKNGFIAEANRKRNVFESMSSIGG